MRCKLLPFVLFLFFANFLSAQTTYDFSTAPALSSMAGFPSSWKNIANTTIGGVEYVLTAGGNGTWTHLANGGNGNSKCLQKDGSGGDQLSIVRKDGKPFQFYGLWVKHSSMYYLPFYKPPYYTITYSKAAGGSESFVYNNAALTSTETYTKDIAVTSVSISFSSIMYYWIDDLKVGPVAEVPAGPEATTSQTNVSCNGGMNGSATVVASGGTAPYTYSWSPSGGTAATASGLAAGNYSCTIKDAALLSVVKSFTITQPVVLSGTISSVNVSCNGGVNGSATVVPSGGTMPYTYNWSPSGGTAATATGLAAGSYTCTITDAKGCSITKSATITEGAAISLVAATHNNVSCNGGSNGSASIAAPTGGAGSYTYNWTPGNPAGDGTRSVSGLSAGSYTVTVTDANSCTATKVFSIVQPAAFSVTPSQNNISCHGGTNGSATVVVSGASAPYFYSWSPSGGTAATATGLSAGTYTCTITDVNECATTQSFTITQPANLEVSATPEQASICSGSEIYIPLSSTPSGASFAWTVSAVSGNVSGAIAGSGSAVSQTLTGSGVVNYIITATLNGCAQTPVTVPVTVKAAPSITTQPVDKTAQIGATVTFSISATNATGYQWKVNTGSGFVNVSNTAPYSGATTAVLTITGATAGMNNYQYVCLASGACSPSATSSSAKLSTKSNNAFLSEIGLNHGVLKPAFSSEVSTYTVEVNPNDATIDLSPYTAHGSATVTVKGSPATSGAPVNLLLSAGLNSVVIKVTAEDGTTVKEYTLNITRPSYAVESIERANGPVTNESVRMFTVRFSGAVTGLSAGNLGFTATGSLNGYAVESITQTAPGVFNVSVNTGSGDGDLNLNLKNGDGLSAPIEELPYQGKDGYRIDRTAPVIKGKNIYATLGADGTATITAADLDNGTTDNYTEALNYTASKTSFNAANLGVNTVVFTATDEAGNSSMVSVTVTIRKDILSVAGMPAINLVYGQAVTLPETVEVMYSDLSKDFLNVSWDKSSYTGKAGTFVLSGTLSPLANTINTESLKAVIRVIVAKKELTVTLKGSVEKEYDGETLATLTGKHYTSDKITDDDVQFEGMAYYDNKKVGSSKTVTVTSLVIAGEDAVNYTLASTTVIGQVGTIKSRPLHISIEAIVEKTYDATTKATLTVDHYATDAVKGDIILVAGSATYENKHAGENKTVTVSGFVITGADKDNYELITTTLSSAGNIILQKNITVLAEATPLITKEYDATNSATLLEDHFSLQGIEKGDEVTVTGLATYADKHVGTEKIITINKIKLGGEDSDNYHLTTQSFTNTGDITPKPLHVNFTEGNMVEKVYDGNTEAQLSPANYALNGVIGEDEVTLNMPSAGVYEDKHAGQAKKITAVGLTISGSSASDYSLSSASVDGNVGVILKKEVAVTANDQTKIYGAADPALSYKVDGLVGNDALSGNLSRTSGRNAGLYDIVIGQLNGGNDYTIGHFVPATLTIVPAALTIKAENKTKSQGTANPVFSFSYSGFAYNDSPSSLESAAVASSAAVIASPIGYYDIVASGAASPNYSITFIKGELTVIPSAKENSNLKVWNSGPGVLKIRIYADREQKAAIVLYTEIGQPIIIQRERLKVGINEFTMPVSHLASSTYVLNVSSERINAGQKVPVK